nr:retrotransposable element Tf2 [Tanacetum cinerariifolium]
MELVLEQTQQGTSHEVSVSTEGVKELKRKVKIKGEKKESLRTLRQKPDEWWYNTNFHTSIYTTPYEAVYGKPPPVHIPCVRGERKVDMADKTKSEKEAIVETLKFYISRAQSRMKYHADKGRTDKKFNCGD